MNSILIFHYIKIYEKFNAAENVSEIAQLTVWFQSGYALPSAPDKYVNKMVLVIVNKLQLLFIVLIKYKGIHIFFHSILIFSYVLYKLDLRINSA